MPTPSNALTNLLQMRVLPVLQVSVAVARRTRIVQHSAIIALALVIGTCSPRLPLWQQIQRTDTLRLVVYSGPTTYYTDTFGPTGFDYNLAKRFANHLGVELTVVLANSPADVIAKLQAGAGDIGGGLTITPDRSEQLHFSPPLYDISAQLVYRAGMPKPTSLADLKGVLEVVPGSSHAELLKKAASAEHSNLNWSENEYADSAELLYKVASGEIDYTVAFSHLVSIVRRYKPQLRVAFDIAKQQSMAWAIAPDIDARFSQAVDDFIDKLKNNGELKRLADTAFRAGYDGGAYVGATTFAKHVKTRLPRYRASFKKAAKLADLDWRMLAAVGYQESHWNPLATSPTGVRGLMMLTTGTARELGVANRLDPYQSINGGARYLRQLIDRIPADIPAPDRVWMALASYNMGYAHLLDVFKLANRHGDDPNRWGDVRKYLPWLTRPSVYQNLKYGYGQGLQALNYVKNIRDYYNILRWMTTDKNKGALPQGVTEAQLQEGVDAAEKALTIDVPSL